MLTDGNEHVINLSSKRQSRWTDNDKYIDLKIHYIGGFI